MSQMSQAQKRRVAKMVAAKMVCGNIDLVRVIKGYVVFGPTPLARAFNQCYTPYVINLLQYPRECIMRFLDFAQNFKEVTDSIPHYHQLGTFVDGGFLCGESPYSMKDYLAWDQEIHNCHDELQAKIVCAIMPLGNQWTTKIKSNKIQTYFMNYFYDRMSDLPDYVYDSDDDYDDEFD
tara:strand:- start:1523 stop:2056 length:534 start_codon:yes stop_codon:yes gene_type:complete